MSLRTPQQLFGLEQPIEQLFRLKLKGSNPENASILFTFVFMNISRLSVTFGFSLLLLGVCETSYALPVARMRGVRPLVEVKNQNRPWKLASERGALVFGDTVRAGARGKADLLFNNGTRIAMRAGSQLQILAPPSDGKPLVVRVFGALSEIFVRAKGPTEIRTAAGTAAVRGTQYLVRVDAENRTTVSVSEGQVAFFNTQGEVLIAPNQTSSAQVGAAPSPPVAVDLSGLLGWTFESAGLPLELENRFSVVRNEGERLFNAGNAAQAAQFFEAQTRAAPTAENFLSLGRALIGAGDSAGAQTAFERAGALSAPPSAAFDESKIGLALTALARSDLDAARANLVGIEPVGTAAPRAQLVAGLIALRAGDVALAQTQFRGAKTRDAASFEAGALLSIALLQSGDVRGALENARGAVQTAPNSALARAALSLALFFGGDAQNARREARRALQIDPLSPLALLAYGRSEAALGSLDEARQAIEQAAALRPDLPLVQRDLGAIYLQLDRLPAAEAAFRAVLAKNPSDGLALAGLGTVLNKTGRSQAAQVAFDAALVAAPRDASVRAQFAGILIENGDLERARTETEAFLKAQSGTSQSGAGAEFGAIFIRLSEEALYRQNLREAFDFGRRAVQILPASAPAHYQFGRVLLEQNRTTQAQAQFRFATALDPNFARARYALGVTQEIAASGRDVSRALGQTSAATEGGPSQGLSLRNLQTPGARERIQAAIQDPNVVRTATRSYGDTEINGAIGQKGVRDADVSVLKESGDRRGVLGVTASHNEAGGVRDNADFGSDRASFTLGRKAKGNPSGVFALGQFEKREFGGNTGLVDDPDVGRQEVENPQLLLGFNLQRNQNARTRFLISAEKPDISTDSSIIASNNRIRSLHGEARHEMRLSEKHRLQFGGAWGFRGASNDRAVTFPDQTITGQRETGVRSQVFYVRDELRIIPRLTLTGELKAVRIAFDTRSTSTFNPALPNGTTVSNSRSETKGFSGLPTVLASFQITPNTNARLRFRQLLGGIEDFELLSPSDVFLFSQREVPVQNFAQRGRSYELEFNHTFPDASFLELGVFQQSARGAGSNLENFNSLRFRGVRARYEGIVSPRTTFFVSGDYNAARGIVDNFGAAPLVNEILAEVPRVRFETGAQYLSDGGFFVQPSVGYFGAIARVNEFFEPRGRRGGFALANLRVGKRSGLRSVFYIEARNLFNREFATTSNVNVTGDLGVGRQLVVGLSRRF